MLTSYDVISIELIKYYIVKSWILHQYNNQNKALI